MKKIIWQYKLRNFTSVDVGVFEDYFENMPYDPYVKEILENEDFLLYVGPLWKFRTTLKHLHNLRK